MPAIYKAFYVYTYAVRLKSTSTTGIRISDINENRSRLPSAGNGTGNYVERQSYERFNEFRAAVNPALIRD